MAVGMVTARWRELLAERVDEATRRLGALPGVRGLIVGGSVGRGDAWPLSDIDLLPIRTPEAREAVERQHALLIDWWAASGRAQTLDVGWLTFTEGEVSQATASPPAWLAERMSDRRWFHGLDKAFGGYGVGDRDGQAEAFAQWATEIRFAPEVVAARLTEWRREALDDYAAGQKSMDEGDLGRATIALRASARALRLVLIEGWGERLGSMGREWTRFERIAERYGARDLAARVATLADADPATINPIMQLTPLWLRERIDLAFAARQAMGEAVSAEESARDQIAAFRVHVIRGHADLGGVWLGLPAPNLHARFTELRRLLDEHCPVDVCGGPIARSTPSA